MLFNHCTVVMYNQSDLTGEFWILTLGPITLRPDSLSNFGMKISPHHLPKLFLRSFLRYIIPPCTTG